MLAAVLALAASAAWGVADFLGGLKSRTVPLLVVLAVAQPVGLVAVALVVAARAEPPPGGAMFLAAPAAVLGTVGIAAFYRGMAIGTISVVAPIAALGVVIPVGFGLARGEDPTAAQLAGFVIAILGVVLASRETSGELATGRLAAGVPWAFLAAVGFGGYFVPMDAASEEDFLWAVLFFRICSTSLVFLAVAIARPPRRLTRADLPTLAAIGILDTAGNAFLAAATSVGLISVVSVLSSLYPVVTVALAWIYLREHVRAVQRVGVALALAGVVVISAG